MNVVSLKRKSKAGFTLAELLIVMAIVIVLTAIAVPTFGRQLETARETADINAIRAAYNDALTSAQIDYADGTLTTATVNEDFVPSQKQTGWNFVAAPKLNGIDINADLAAATGVTKVAFEFETTTDGVLQLKTVKKGT